MLHGVDLSHHNDDNGPINFDLLRGHVDFVITKVTQGNAYIDPTANRHVSETRRIGAVPGLYHFAVGSNNPILDAAFFLTHSPDPTGAFIALDWETAASDPVSWCMTWLTTVRDKWNVKPLVYMNKNALRSFDWSPVVAADFGLWTADYDGNAADFSERGAWPALALKQYSDAGTESGVTGGVDEDSFNGSLDQLRAYCVAGAPAPVPVPAPRPPDNPWLALPSLVYGQRNDAGVRSLQSFLLSHFPAYRAKRGALTVTGNYLDITTAWVLEFQQRTGITSGDGRNIGPQTKAKLWQYGWRG